MNGCEDIEIWRHDQSVLVELGSKLNPKAVFSNIAGRPSSKSSFSFLWEAPSRACSWVARTISTKPRERSFSTLPARRWKSDAFVVFPVGVQILNFIMLTFLLFFILWFFLKFYTFNFLSSVFSIFLWLKLYTKTLFTIHEF